MAQLWLVTPAPLSRHLSRMTPWIIVAALSACAGGPGDPTQPGPASPAMSTITAAPTQIKGDGVSTAQITVQLRDDSGTPEIQGGDFVEVLTDYGTMSPTVDKNNGLYVATLTSSTQVGITATISGSLNGSQILSTKPTVTFIP